MPGKIFSGEKSGPKKQTAESVKDLTVHMAQFMQQIVI
jgi:hypothetical protein